MYVVDTQLRFERSTAAATSDCGLHRGRELLSGDYASTPIRASLLGQAGRITHADGPLEEHVHCLPSEASSVQLPRRGCAPFRGQMLTPLPAPRRTNVPACMYNANNSPSRRCKVPLAAAQEVRRYSAVLGRHNSSTRAARQQDQQPALPDSARTRLPRWSR